MLSARLDDDDGDDAFVGWNVVSPTSQPRFGHLTTSKDSLILMNDD